MKLTHILSVATALLVLAAPAALAGKGKAKAAGGGKEAKQAARKATHAAAQYDANKDGAITGDESAALRKAFDADKTGPLKPLDLNADGTLEDNEIAAIKIVKKGEKKGGKKKKNA